MRCRPAKFVWPVLVTGLLYAGVNTPKIGLVRYSSGTVRPVYGVPGSFAIASAMTKGAIAISFSDSAGLIVVDGLIRLVLADGTTLDAFHSAERSPVLNISGGPETAIAWLPSSQSLVYWNGKKLVETSLTGSLPGPVTSLERSSTSRAELYCLQPDDSSVRVSLAVPVGTIESVDTMPGVLGRAWNFDGMALFINGAGLHASDKTGVTEDFKLPDDLRVERMSSSYLHLWSPETREDWVLRVENSRAELWLLPAEPNAAVETGK